MSLTRAPFRRLPRGQVYLDAIGVLGDAGSHLASASPPGTVVQQFERAFAASLDAPSAIALPHARVALQQLLKVLALPHGSEVIMTPVTIPEIVVVILSAGLVPVFVDLGERTCNVDCDDLERKITPRTRLILVTHLAGLPSDMARVMALAERHGLEVLEDCSQVPGTRHKGRQLGLWGRAGFFSLTPLKPVSTLYGGMTITTDPAIERELRRLDADAPPPLPRAKLLRLLARDLLMYAVTDPMVFSLVTHHAVRVFDRVDPAIVREFGRGNFLNDPARRRGAVKLGSMPAWRNARYSDFQAATGLRGLRSLHDDNRRRRDLSLLLLERLSAAAVPGLLRLPADASECTFWRFPLWVEEPSGESTKRDALRRHLFACGIDSSPTNLECCSGVAAFAEHAARTPEAQRFVDHMLFLPMHPNLTEDDMRRIADAVAAFRG